MKYIGLQEQITSNNRKSVILLLMFPLLVLAMVYAFTFIAYYSNEYADSITYVNQEFLATIPIVIIAVGIWFAIAYFSNTAIINLTRSEEHTSELQSRPHLVCRL